MMKLTDNTKILILVAIICAVIYFFIQNRINDDDEATHNEGSLTQEHVKTNIKNISQKDYNDESLEEIVKDVMTEEHDPLLKKRPKRLVSKPTAAQLQESNVNVLKKFRTRNSTKDGRFVSSNYVDGKRGSERASNLDKFFEEGHPLDDKIGYQKNDPQSHDIQFANYVPGKQRKLRDVDKFNSDALLPKENNKDWFDEPYEATTVKNSHLLNIGKPISINTISSSLKNANRQLRPEPTAPKIPVSPWMNSTIEPDTNIGGSGLCL